MLELDVDGEAGTLAVVAVSVTMKDAALAGPADGGDGGARGGAPGER